jgi:hypothetical protein
MAVDAARVAVRATSLARREALLASALSAAVAVTLAALGPPAGDAAAHLYRTELVREGVLVWDGLWYGGHYPLASYSLLFYLPAALVGAKALALLAVVASAALFAVLVVREWGERACWPARAFAVLGCAPIFTGTYAYAAGLAAALGALVLLQRARPWAALACAALAAGFSPLAFAFLVLVVCAVWVVRRPPAGLTVRVGAGLAVIGGALLGVEAAFPQGGRYGFRATELAYALGACSLIALIASRSRQGRLLAAVLLAIGLACLIAYVVPSPVGSNLTRFRAYAFPLALLAACLVSFRPRWLTVPAVALALFYSVSPYVAVAGELGDTRAAAARFWASTLDAVRARTGPDYRVDVVPTFDNWEAYHVPAADLPLARGWYRQVDLARNGVLYRDGLTGGEYRAWLRSRGVRLVVLPLAPLDRLGAIPQADLLRSGRSGLVEVARTPEAVVYELPAATPILTGPADERITAYGHERIAGTVGAPGTYTLRVASTPYLSVEHGSVCLEPGANGTTRLVASRAGPFELGVPGPSELLRIAFGARPDGC